MDMHKTKETDPLDFIRILPEPVWPIPSTVMVNAGPSQGPARPDVDRFRSGPDPYILVDPINPDEILDSPINQEI